MPKLPKFDEETTIAALELEQMLAAYNRETDFNEGRDGPDFFTADCSVNVGAITFRGHEGVRKYFADRAENIRKTEKDGIRTTRHSYANLAITFENKNRATLQYLIVTYASGGKPPIMDAMTPVVIADARLECRRDSDGQWRFVELHGAPVFIATQGPAQKAMIGR